jgi:hypothetical protein
MNKVEMGQTCSSFGRNGNYTQNLDPITLRGKYHSLVSTRYDSTVK